MRDGNPYRSPWWFPYLQYSYGIVVGAIIVVVTLIDLGIFWDSLQLFLFVVYLVAFVRMVRNLRRRP